MRDPTEQKRPNFIAFVYPGWHATPYRSEVDEWRLLDNFTPFFDGHLPPPQPLGGRYDDADPATSRSQIDMALSYGINGFMYFAYYGAQGWVMDTPMRVSLANAEPKEFSIAGSWCIRLPHDQFPVPPHDALEAASAENKNTQTLTTAIGDATENSHPLDDVPIERLTLAGLSQLVEANDPIWNSVDLMPRQADVRSSLPKEIKATSTPRMSLKAACVLIDTLSTLADSFESEKLSLGAVLDATNACNLGHLPLQSMIGLLDKFKNAKARFPNIDLLSVLTLKELELALSQDN